MYQNRKNLITITKVRKIFAENTCRSRHTHTHEHYLFVYDLTWMCLFDCCCIAIFFNWKYLMCLQLKPCRNSEWFPFNWTKSLEIIQIIICLMFTNIFMNSAIKTCFNCPQLYYFQAFIYMLCYTKTFHEPIKTTISDLLNHIFFLFVIIQAGHKGGDGSERRDGIREKHNNEL